MELSGAQALVARAQHRTTVLSRARLLRGRRRRRGGGATLSPPPRESGCCSRNRNDPRASERERERGEYNAMRRGYISGCNAREP